MGTGIDGMPLPFYNTVCGGSANTLSVDCLSRFVEAEQCYQHSDELKRVFVRQGITTMTKQTIKLIQK